MKVLFDTNILIYFLQGDPRAKKILKEYSIRYISTITYLEVLTGLKETEKEPIKSWLQNSFKILNVTREIAELAAHIRSEKKLKTPDAIILATAIHENAILFTNDTKGFKDTFPNVHLPFKNKK